MQAMALIPSNPILNHGEQHYLDALVKPPFKTAMVRMYKEQELGDLMFDGWFPSIIFGNSSNYNQQSTPVPPYLGHSQPSYSIQKSLQGRPCKFGWPH